MGVSASLRCATAVYLIRELIRLEHQNSETSSKQFESISLDPPTFFQTWPKIMVESLGHICDPYFLSTTLIYIDLLVSHLPDSIKKEEHYEVSIYLLFVYPFFIHCAKK